MPGQPTGATAPDLLIVVGYGNGGQRSSDEFDRLIPALETRLNIPVEAAFLDGSPSTGECIQQAVITRKPRYGIVLPLFVGATQTKHQNQQMIVQAANERGFDTVMHYGKPLGLHSGLIDAYRARLAEVYMEDTTLLVVGRGSRDPISNAEVHDLAGLLTDNIQWQRVQVAFHTGGEPTIAAAIEQCLRSGSRRIVILPYVLYDRHLAAAIETEVRSHSYDIELIFTTPLGDDRGILEAISRRVQEAWQTLTSELASDGKYIPRSHSHGAGGSHTHRLNLASDFQNLLPPRYQNDQEVSAAPMGSADLVYDAQGQVAWDQIWGDFCDLALAGGPPHRGTLLEPVAPESVLANPQQYQRVLAELERGIHLVTRLPVITNASLGWIGVQCVNEAMALWLLRAIVVENISIRREGTVLYLPAAPDFRLEHEIKNIITVMAKTHHYWTEHITEQS